ncbi:hypothetical protein L1049_008434 [Liquidambar formosana]|uniref:Uncharacterized protein n=1 Tax=Liquidambar formosana TaxID=63359 RepID=A0AAP0S9E6_LIQFO
MESQIATFITAHTNFPLLLTTFSGHVNQALITNIVYINKKRKFQAEQLGLPLSKHKCCKQIFSSECESPLNKNPEAEDFCTHIINGKTEGEVSDDGSEPESGKDSNSFAADSDSAMSVYNEIKFGPEYAKTSANDQLSTSSLNWGSSSFKNTLCSMDSRTVKNMGTGKEKLIFTGGEHNSPHHDGGFQVCQNLEEQLLEFGNHVGYSCSVYDNDSIEHCTDEELDDMLYSNGVNSNNYVLSSGRWSVNQEAQLGTKKPTIDQEFEQYFSMLML